MLSIQALEAALQSELTKQIESYMSKRGSEIVETMISEKLAEATLSPSADTLEKLSEKLDRLEKELNDLEYKFDSLKDEVNQGSGHHNTLDERFDEIEEKLSDIGGGEMSETITRLKRAIKDAGSCLQDF